MKSYPHGLDASCFTTDAAGCVTARNPRDGTSYAWTKSEWAKASGTSETESAPARKPTKKKTGR